MQRNMNVTFFCDTKLRHEDFLKYPGAVLDCSLIYCLTSAKIKPTNNIINKVAGASWGADAHILCTATLALIFSVAECCTPAWADSIHTKLVDMQLNTAVTITTGVLKSALTVCLHVLTCILPPSL